MGDRAALRIGLRWLIPVRFCAAASQLVATITLGVATGAFPVLPALLTLAPIVATNVALARTTTTPSEDRVFGLLLLDVVLLSTWLVLAGGPSNPWSALYLVEVALAAFMLGDARPWIVTASAALGFGATFVMTGDDVAHAHGGSAFDSHLEGMYVAYVVSSVLITFFVSRMATALHERESELATSRERGARYERALAMTTLAAGAAHELGTPLATIAVAAKELERDLVARGSDALLVDDARLVREEVQRCRAILDRMAMRAGHLVGSAPVVVDLTAFEAPLRESLGESKFDRVERTIDPGSVSLPEHAIATIVENLVRNALDAAPEPSKVRLSLRLSGNELTITVSDCGGGMDEATRARAFDPFFTTKEPGKGMGLGLFLVHSLADDLGGTVTIDSQLGRGTDVVVRLPLEGSRP